MIDRLKAMLHTVTDVLLAVLAAIAYYLVNKNRSLEDRIEEEKAKNALQQTIDEQKSMDAKANDSMSAYESAKREYDSSGPKNVS